MNPYIKSLGFTDIMSGSEEKTPTVSPDQGATGETTTSSENKKAGTHTGLSEEEKEARYKEEYRNDVIKLLRNIQHGIHYNSGNFRNFGEYIGMLQKVLTLVQQFEDNDRKGEKNN